LIDSTTSGRCRRITALGAQRLAQLFFPLAAGGCAHAEDGEADVVVEHAAQVALGGGAEAWHVLLDAGDVEAAVGLRHRHQEQRAVGARPAAREGG
jgi:hypothetical protein